MDNKEEQAKETELKQESEISHSGAAEQLGADIEFLSSGNKIPCEIRQEAFLPYWEKKDGEITYGIDVYEIIALSGCGDIWMCKLVDKDGNESGHNIEPNVDVFFSQKDAEKKIAGLKKTEDPKKLSKWKRRNIKDVGC